MSRGEWEVSPLIRSVSWGGGRGWMGTHAHLLAGTGGRDAWPRARQRFDEERERV